MAEQKIQGVIFDLDGTLYRLRFMKARMTFSLWSQVKYLRELFPSRARVRETEHADRSSLLRFLYRDLGERTGSTESEAEQWYQGKFMPAFVNLLERSAKARNGLVPLLEALKAKGLRLAVVSDFSHVAERLTALDVSPGLFDTLRCSEEFGVLKPSAEPFLAVARDWGVAPAEVLVVGDRDDMDGECARRAGMRFIGIANKKTGNTDFYPWKEALSQIGAQTNVE